MTYIAIIAAAVAAALAIALLFGGVALMLRDRRSSVSARLQRWSGSPGASGGLYDREKKRHKTHGDLTAVRGFVVQQVDRAVARQSFAEKIRRRLARADLKWTVGEFLLLNAVATLVGALVGWFLFGHFIHVVVCTAAGLFLPHWIVRMKQRSRLKKFNNQLGDTIAMLANSLRSGYSMLQSMDLVGREMAPPISDEFQRVTREVGLGLTPEEALANLVRRINSVDLELMVTAINVQREVGGNLAEILDIIANTMSARVLEEMELATPFSERVLKPLLKRLAHLAARVSPGTKAEAIALKLAMAGNPRQLTVETFLGLKVVAALVFAGVALLAQFLLPPLIAPPALVKTALWTVVAAVVGFFLPELWIKDEIRKRQKAIRKVLPDTIDILSISVEAGLGFDAAMSRICHKAHNPLTAEFEKYLTELRLGKGRREALRQIQTRTGVEDLNTFIGAVIQADQLGTSMAKILRVQSEQLRTKRRQRAEQLAQQAPLKMLFPMIMFIFPSVFVVILGPSIPQIMSGFST